MTVNSTLNLIKTEYAQKFTESEQKMYPLDIITIPNNNIAINIANFFYKHRLLCTADNCDDVKNITTFFFKLKNCRWLRSLTYTKHIIVIADEVKVRYMFCSTFNLDAACARSTTISNFISYYHEFIYKVNNFDEDMLVVMQAIAKPVYDNLVNIVNAFITNPENTFVLSANTQHSHMDIKWIKNLKIDMLTKTYNNIPADVLAEMVKISYKYNNVYIDTESFKRSIMKAILSQLFIEAEYASDEHAFKIVVTKLANKIVPFVLVYKTNEYDAYDELNKCKNQVAILTTKLANITDENQQLKIQLASSNEKLKKLIDENQQLKEQLTLSKKLTNENQKLKEQLKKITDENQQLKEQLANANKQLTIMNTPVIQNKKSKHNAGNSDVILRQKNKELTEEVNKLQSQLTIMSKQYRTKLDENDKFINNLKAQHDAAIDVANQQIIELHSQLSRNREEIREEIEKELKEKYEQEIDNIRKEKIEMIENHNKEVYELRKKYEVKISAMQLAHEVTCRSGAELLHQFLSYKK